LTDFLLMRETLLHFYHFIIADLLPLNEHMRWWFELNCMCLV